MVFISLIVFQFADSSSAQVVGKYRTLSESLAAVQDKFHLTLGLEVAVDDPDKDPIVLDLSSPDPAVAFNQIVAQRAWYHWNFQDGVYDLSPKDGPQSVLDITITSYSVRNLSVVEASDAISKLPEVQQWLVEHNVRRRELETGPPASDGKVSLSLTDVNLRAVLNAVARRSAGKRWTVVRYGDRMQYLAIYF